MTRSVQLVVSLSVLLAALPSCAGAPPASQRIVAATGGSVTGSVYRLAIPAMALPADAEVTLETASASTYPTLAGALPEVLRIQPEGTVLEHAATVTIRGDFIDAAAGDTISVSQLLAGDGVSIWQPLESTRDAATGDVAVSVTLFSPLAVVVAHPAAGAGGIRGTLHWGDASAAPAAPIQLFQGTSLLRTTTTDAAGGFSFADLSAGEYRIVVEYECHLEQPVTVTAGTTTQQNLVICGR